MTDAQGTGAEVAMSGDDGIPCALGLLRGAVMGPLGSMRIWGRRAGPRGISLGVRSGQRRSGCDGPRGSYAKEPPRDEFVIHEPAAASLINHHPSGGGGTAPQDAAAAGRGGKRGRPQSPRERQAITRRAAAAEAASNHILQLPWEGESREADGGRPDASFERGRGVFSRLWQLTVGRYVV